ncbi:MAG: hypothetical protein LC799_27660 [Actinobacteria bacterium]|nr:hypothetical protein [Actinomycetota bacterium]
MHTKRWQLHRCLHAVDRARETLDAPGLTPELPWFDYYDATRVSGFAGYATLRADRYDDAHIELDTALGKVTTPKPGLADFFRHARDAC